MSNVYGVLTVFFENPFWVGVFERIENGGLRAAKVTFGARPKDSEIYEFVLKNYSKLSFSPQVEGLVVKKALNPKRIRRDAGRLVRCSGTGTKSQQALAAQREWNKLEKAETRRENKRLKSETAFAQKQLKKKEKHKGR